MPDRSTGNPAPRDSGSPGTEGAPGPGAETSPPAPRQGAPHHDELTRLRRIEGQVRGIQGMVEADRYCIDILTQIRSVLGALEKVSDSILERHLRHCVADAFASDDPRAKEEKLQEVLRVLEKARR
ncbi:MAG: metal-sensitive transcriptional regulator [Thermoanaerobaculia bacterium]|nr:metal-sensitive transcriptional regulator [Thermoanaerobaculia bacterium]